jgi:acetylornithine deacetylase/succinyl-diaminopimelate desuccinylase-like protein
MPFLAAATLWLLIALTSFAPAQVPASFASAQRPPIDWTPIRAESLRHFRALVQIDTSNPPGNEIKAVEYLQKVLTAEGIPSKTLALDPNRPNLVARLKGTGARRPLLLLAHTDVVGVQRDKWPVDPFGAVLRDGYIWGRGTTDDKDNLTANLMAFLLAKRSGTPLERDLIFLAESGEEADPAGVGIRFLVEQHFDEIDAEFALGEGPGAAIEDGRVRRVQIATTEKLPRRVRLVATGTSGHGSIPRLDNPVTHLASAVQKIGTWSMPMRLNDTTRLYFEKLATISTPERAARYRSLVSGQGVEAAERYLAEHEPEHNAILRTSLVPTMLQAGFGPNVIPSTAEAVIDIRALPDEDVPRLMSEIANRIADPAVTVVPLASPRPVAKPSPVDSELYKILEEAAAKVYPGATVLPSMMTAATDMAQLRAKGVHAYGIGPAMSGSDFAQHSWHSDVERLSEDSLHQFVQYMWTVVSAAVAGK